MRVWEKPPKRSPRAP